MTKRSESPLMSGACNYSTQFISVHIKTQYPYCSLKKYIFSSWYHKIPPAMKMLLEGETSTLLSSEMGTTVLWWAQAPKQTHPRLNQPEVNFFSYLAVLIWTSKKKKKKKRLLQLECSVVFGHFQKTITFFWGGSISSKLFIAACAHSKRHWGPVLFKRFICEIV